MMDLDHEDVFDDDDKVGEEQPRVLIDSVDSDVVLCIL